MKPLCKNCCNPLTKFSRRSHASLLCRSCYAIQLQKRRKKRIKNYIDSGDKLVCRGCDKNLKYNKNNFYFNSNGYLDTICKSCAKERANASQMNSLCRICSNPKGINNNLCVNCRVGLRCFKKSIFLFQRAVEFLNENKK